MYSYYTMTKINMPFVPRPKLTEMLARRNQTLLVWVTEVGVSSQFELEQYCALHKLQTPTASEMVDIWLHSALPPASVPVSLMVIQKPIDSIEVTFTIPSETEAEDKKAKKTRNALVKTDESAPETAKVPEEPKKTVG